MINDQTFEELLSSDEPRREQFISSFLKYIEEMKAYDVKKAIENRDYNQLLEILINTPEDKLPDALSLILQAGRFIYLLKKWNL
jgi:hypothetical protein